MDTPKPPQKPAQLLNDLESIRELLGDQDLEPPLLVDALDPDAIPVLSDIVAAAPPGAPPPAPSHRPEATASPAQSDAGLRGTLEQAVLRDSAAELKKLDNELRAAAQLILQDVIDDFVPQIEAELKRRLEARLTRLLPPRRG
ncbi:DNA polymerase III subunit chi [Pseudomonas lalucatii]|uniref:DNA polymerase III subunit chi n=1 Tax=Pseudomonas lalucatii TaxID=1424203 RepID=A0ABS5Q4J2_9PSED|nr:DNA polymerase III subunit chi [Pseudomonas lalucatii]MBS7663677.1 DNA polymerase III subunit chi [Pseudomonas lalucatii]MBS7725157.1 DNA polymerase III subunit chi [Pseudomonas lalucatii]